MQGKIFIVGLGVVGLVALGGCEPKSGRGHLSYAKDVKPILDQYCGECHMPGGPGAEKSGFKVDNYRNVMKGTKFGPVIIPGSAESSTLYRLVAGKVDPSIRMPHGKEPLKPEEIETIRQWIEEGANEY